MNGESISLVPIGFIRSCYPEKFGIPRQAGMVEEARATIVLFSIFNRPEIVKGLDQFSHIWVHFLFHQAVEEGWRPTVRPPGLGGQERVGVFASRSPHRPNHLGFSAVRLLSIKQRKEGIMLEVAGGDFLDGTPVIDIKPYVPFCDVISHAESGYSGRSSCRLEIVFSEESLQFCREYEVRTGRRLEKLISQVLLQDPRPASQREKKEDFGFCLWDVNIRWKVRGKTFTVTECTAG